METVTFRFSDVNRSISTDEALWLVGQLRAARELAPAAAAIADRIAAAIDHEAAIDPTLDENRELIDALERGARKPRSLSLRQLEVELHTTLYAEGYFNDD